MHMACSKRLNQRFVEDMISELPDPLICHMLNHLPTKDVVKTSVLSTRWRSLWLWVPSLELRLQDFTFLDDFVSFGDRFFDSDRASCIQKLKLTIDVDKVKDDTSYLTSWIDAAVKRKVQHLDLHLRGQFSFFAAEPVRFYNCETLVYLKIVEVPLAKAEFVYLPCLKFMHLQDNLYANEDSFEKLVSSCPVLEELNIFIHEEDEGVFRVHSRSLKKITLVRPYAEYIKSVPGVVIDAPLLCSMSIGDSASESFIVNDLASKAKLDISLRFGSGDFDGTKTSNNIHSFFLGIRSVADMTLCEKTFEVICQYLSFEQLPRFDYMSCLNLTLRLSDLKWLPTFLESCPNVKFLFLGWYYGYEKMLYEEMNQISFSSVPLCLLSSLQSVDLRVRILGLTPEMNLIRYLLGNSAVLQTFTIRLANHSMTYHSSLEELLRIPRSSTKCKLAIF